MNCEDCQYKRERDLLIASIVRVAARLDEELEARGAGKAVEQEYLKEIE